MIFGYSMSDLSTRTWIAWDDVLVVTKLDRLGRNAMDVRSSIEQLAELQVRVHCLALDGVDLTSAAGKMTMAVIAAVAGFERDLLVERTQSGLARAKAQGKKLGRPRPLTKEQQEILELRGNKDYLQAQLPKNITLADRLFKEPY